MSDTQFQWSMISVSVLTLLWIITGIVFTIISGAVVIITGLVVWLVVSGLLIHYWGKNYMSRE
jgi:uncharacterized membrane protein